MKTKNLNAHEVEAQRADERARWPKRVRFSEHFFDGALIPAFEAIDQDPHIQRNEIRELPAELLEKCIQSGAKVEPVL
jgi:hypothetical protein